MGICVIISMSVNSQALLILFSAVMNEPSSWSRTSFVISANELQPKPAGQRGAGLEISSGIQTTLFTYFHNIRLPFTTRKGSTIAQLLVLLLYSQKA